MPAPHAYVVEEGGARGSSQASPLPAESEAADRGAPPPDAARAPQAVQLAKGAGWGVLTSHRSGETADDFIADIAVGLSTGHIKSGAPARCVCVVRAHAAAPRAWRASAHTRPPRRACVIAGASA